MKHQLWHEILWSVCRKTWKYRHFKQYHQDCSCGCIWFKELAGSSGGDWGVCANIHSPRRGLLTFEHMGCKFFEEET